MYIALGIMLCGMLIGRILCNYISSRLLRPCIMCAILLLLFLLGLSIGGNAALLAQLGSLGLEALLLTLFCVAGSIAAQCILAHSPAGKKILGKIKK